MTYGYKGKILFVDLDSGKSRPQEVSEHLKRMYLGGRGWGSLLLSELVPKGVDPLERENVLMFLTGPITGTLVPGGSKYVVVTKSPVSGGFCDSYASGRIAVEIKASGYDGIVIHGKAKEPSILFVSDEKVSVLPAGDLWGKDTFSTERKLKEAYGEDCGVACIGPAGERLVAYAIINSDYFRQAARGGVGSVMGSKLLKALVIRGNQGIQCYDRRRVLDMVKNYKEGLENNDMARQRRKYGTSMVTNLTHSLGMLPTRNFQAGMFPEGVNEIGGDAFASDVIRHRACLGCILACAQITKVGKGDFAGETQEGPEYESIAMLGSNLGIKDRGLVFRANILCDQLGLDTISAGNTIGFLMECFEKGLVSQEFCDGLEVKFGNSEVVFELLHRIAHRQGIGDLLCQGVRQVAETIGKGALDFAMQVKGLEFPAYDPRAGFGIALAYAVSPRGACHRRAWPPKIESFGKLPPDTIEGKPEIVKRMYDDNCIFHSLLACDFPCRVAPVSIKEFAEYLNALTGLNWTEEDLNTLADRVETAIRLYNLQEGLSRDDDRLPNRVFKESFSMGPNKGLTVPYEGFQWMLSEYYQLRGWDEKGVPRPETLKKLGIFKNIKTL